MKKFLLWMDGWNSEDDPSSIESLDAECAVEKWCERMHSAWDYPVNIEAIFCKDEVGTITQWVVLVETVAHFCAAPLNTKRTR